MGLLDMASEHESGGGVRMRTVHLYAFGLGPRCSRIRGRAHDLGRDFIHMKSRSSFLFSRVVWRIVGAALLRALLQTAVLRSP